MQNKNNINNNKKKIIFVHFFNNYSGSPKVLQLVINSLYNYNGILITNDTEGFLTNTIIPHIKVKFRLSNKMFVTLLNYIRAQITIFYFVLIYANKGDILYINTTIPIFAGFAGRIKNAKIVFHLHEDVKSLNLVHRTVSKFRKYVCDIEIFVSNYLLRQEHIVGKKNYILYNVVPKEFYDEGINNDTNRKYNRPFNILMICSLKKYKGVHEFIKIANKLLLFSDIKFNLLVNENNYEIHKFFQDSQVPDNVTFHEKTVNTLPFYKISNVLLNLSRPDEWVETFGLTIIEGMTFGLPCIVPPIGGPIELIDDGINGYKISSYETDRIVEKIIKLYNDKELYMFISQNNKEKVKINNYITFQETINNIINETFKNSKKS